MKVLIVDDNVEFGSTIADIVSDFGYKYENIYKPTLAIEYLSKHHSSIGIVLLDIEFGPEEQLSGLDVLEAIRKSHPSLPVVMVSGKGTIETAVRATKLGAMNFIEKSIISKEKIKEVLNSALGKKQQGEEEEIRKFLEANGIIARSKAMLDVGDRIIRFGRTDLNVLITGETGTGKKLVAKAIHAASRRNKYPFVTVDIPNIPKELFQSELFGHIKGAFSGASENKKGLFHQANKGTLFLDEIGDMSLSLQSNLFIPIEEKVVRKVGSVQSEEMDIRFVSATDKDLLEGIKDGNFREQLYHRLRECEIHLPSLQERQEDIPEIIKYFLQKHNADFNDEKFFAPSALDYMQEQTWRGNVRELSSVLRVTLQTATTKQIEVSDLHRIISNSSQTIETQVVAPAISLGNTLKEDLALVDKRKIETTLEQCRGNVSKSAALLGVSRETLHNKIRKYDINVQSYRQKKTV